MKYIKTYEFNWVPTSWKKKIDYQKILSEHIKNFISEQVPEKRIEIDGIDNAQIFGYSNENKMLLNIQSDNYIKYVNLNIVNYYDQLIPFLAYDESLSKLNDVINYLQETLKEFAQSSSGDDPINNYNFYIEKSKINDFMKNLNKENYELFRDIKKYNL